MEPSWESRSGQHRRPTGAPEGRRNKAWGFNPRTGAAPPRSVAPKGRRGCFLRPFGATKIVWGGLPGVETPGFIPAALRALGYPGPYDPTALEVSGDHGDRDRGLQEP